MLQPGVSPSVGLSVCHTRCWHCIEMAYQTVPSPMTLNDLHHLLQAFARMIFHKLCWSWQNFNWHRASCGPSAIAEIVVFIWLWHCKIHLLRSLMPLCRMVRAWTIQTSTAWLHYSVLQNLVISTSSNISWKLVCTVSRPVFVISYGYFVYVLSKFTKITELNNSCKTATNKSEHDAYFCICVTFHYSP